MGYLCLLLHSISIDFKSTPRAFNASVSLSRVNRFAIQCSPGGPCWITCRTGWSLLELDRTAANTRDISSPNFLASCPCDLITILIRLRPGGLDSKLQALTLQSSLTFCSFQTSTEHISRIRHTVPSQATLYLLGLLIWDGLLARA